MLELLQEPNALAPGKKYKLFNAAVIVASLGYFVDVYDLLLFSIVRVPSLLSLGLEGHNITNDGIMLLNVQMVGLLVGGIFWGVLGDKKGRLSVLFGSIFLYSLANIANGLVHTVEGYALWRFVAGVGLAGELGAGITLVAELMPKEKRGYATTMVAAVGVSGAIAAWAIAKIFDWRIFYFIGGALGLSLLVLRVSVRESAFFIKKKNQVAKRGNFLSLFASKERLIKYLCCIGIGVPLWFVVGILITLSPEFGKAIGVQGIVDGGTAVACCYAGLVLGDIASGLLSQYLQSRRKVLYTYLSLASCMVLIFLFLPAVSLPVFYFVCAALGFSVGYWVIFVTVATEQFGTNIRATVTTTVPNFVRASLVPVSFIFQYSKSFFNGSFIYAGLFTAIISLLIAFISLRKISETFSKDLDYIES